MTIRPPGLTTRASSERTRWVSGTTVITNIATAASKLPSGESEVARVHLVERLDIAELLPLDPPRRALEHVGAEVDADDAVVALVERQRDAGADTELENAARRALIEHR